MAGEADDLREVRRTYEHATLDLEDLGDDERADPLVLLRRWLDEAIAHDGDPEPTAMVLATVAVRDEGPAPDARVVLCKGVDHGVVFFTNGGSAKGRQLGAVDRGAVVFHWAGLERQVRCRGAVARIADVESDEYFASRPRGSRIGAWASVQSRPVEDREALERQAREAAARFADGPVPRPEPWCGYRLVPDEVELWQGRPSRLHDRLLATRRDDGWQWTRLQP